MVSSNTFVADTLYFIKNDLSSNITDPLSGSRPGNSTFVLTAYPAREAVYPIITLKVLNYNFLRAGMQTTAMDGLMNIEIRIWARNTKERDTIFTSVLNRLRTIQFTANTGSVENDLHDFNMPSAVEVNDEGENGIKSKIMEVTYKFYNI